MPIRSIEVICIPCAKCEKIKSMINDATKSIELQNKIKIVYDFKHTTNLRDISKYSINASQTPIVVINGQVEVAGQIELPALKNKLEVLHRY